MISSGPYADELMLSLEKIARPLTLREALVLLPLAVDRPPDQGGAQPSQRRSSTLAARGPFARVAISSPSSPRWNGSSNGRTMSHVGVADALAAPLLADLEEWIDLPVVRRLWASCHGAQR